MKKMLFFLIFLLITFPRFIQAQGAQNQNIVQTNNTYSYEEMVQDLQQLDEKYGELIKVFKLGKTEYGRGIYAVKLGYGPANVFYNGAHHAREWITSVLTMKMLEEYADAYQKETEYGDNNVKEILDHTTIWFIPMVNPDGVTLQQKGLSAFPNDVHQKLINMNYGSLDFTRWKANAQGIDLNRQYPANWEGIVANRDQPRFSNYKGERPFQAEEVKLLKDFTMIINPELTVSYHSSGHILYWNFHTRPANYNRDYWLAYTLGKMTGYSLVKPKPNPSGGGYTDWFIQEFGKPAFTPEVGPFTENQHVDMKNFNEEWNKNKFAGLYLAQQGYKLWQLKQDKKVALLNDKIFPLKELMVGILDGDDIASYVLELKEEFQLSSDKLISLYSLQKAAYPSTIKANELAKVFPEINLLEELNNLEEGNDLYQAVYFSISNEKLNFYVPIVKGTQSSLKKVNQALLNQKRKDKFIREMVKEKKKHE